MITPKTPAVPSSAYLDATEKSIAAKIARNQPVEASGSSYPEQNELLG